MAVTYEPIEFLLPFVSIIVPALFIYVVVRSRAGLVSGVVIGITLGVESEILPTWTITFAVLGIAATIFLERESLPLVGRGDYE